MESNLINPYKLFNGIFTPLGLLERTELSQGSKLCYGLLCRYAGENGSCYPKQDTLANDLGVTKFQIIRYLKELEINNLIKKERLGKKLSNRYFFLMHPWLIESLKKGIKYSSINATSPSSINATSLSSINATSIGSESFEVIYNKENKPPNPLKKGEGFQNNLRESFKKFWEIYPKKRSKGDAEKAWAKIKPNEHLVEKILQAVQRAMTSEDWVKQNGKFIPYPASWLNARGWEDEILERKEANEDERFSFLEGNQKAGDSFQTPTTEPGHT